MTWALTLVFVVAVDVGVTHSSLLWGKTNLWIRGGLERMYVWQTYEVARKIYHPRRAAAVRVALLGNSRIWGPGRDVYVERELRRLRPTLDVRVDNLAIFGARVGDQEIISRHLDRLQPALVVLTLSGSDLVATSWGKLVNPTGEMFDSGWRDGPLPPESQAARVNRWVRTVWPLYRFRRFAREVITDRLFPVATDAEYPDHFASAQEYFDFISGERRGAKAGAAYAVWRRDPSLTSFVAYLGGMWKGLGFSEPVPPPESLTLESPGIKLLDVLLARLAQGPWSSFVLLMPESPILDADTTGAYHRPGFSDHAAGLIREVAGRHEGRVVDGRRWMPAETFADFVHVFPDLSGFQTPLAKEILHAIDSQ